MSDYDCVSTMLPRSSRNGQTEVTLFSVPVTPGSYSVIQRNKLRNTSGLTALGTLSASPICKEQMWIFNVPCHAMIYCGLNLKNQPKLVLKVCGRVYCQFGTTETQSVSSIIDSSTLL